MTRSQLGGCPSVQGASSGHPAAGHPGRRQAGAAPRDPRRRRAAAAALARPHRERGRGRRRGGPRQGHRLPLFPEQGRAAARACTSATSTASSGALVERLRATAEPVPIDRRAGAHAPAHGRAAAVPAARGALLRHDGHRACRSRPAIAFKQRMARAPDGAPAPGSSAISPSSRRASGVALLRHSYALIIGLWQMSAESAAHRLGCPMDPGERVPGLQLFDYPDELDRGAARAVAAARRRATAERDRNGRSVMNAIAAVSFARVASRVAVAGCAKQEPPPEVVRPVQLTQVAIGPTARDRGVRGRSEAAARSRPRLSHRRQDRRAPRRRRRAREEGPGARAARSRRRRLAGRGRRRRRSPRPRPNTDSRRPSSSATRTCTGEKFISASRARCRSATRSTPTARSSSRRRRTSPCAEPGELRDARRQRRRRGHGGQRRAGPGRRRRRSRSCASRARTSAKSRSACPRTASASSSRAQQLVVVLWANPRQAVSPRRVREIAPAVDPATRTFAVRVVDRSTPMPRVQWGMTANVGVLARGQCRRRRSLPLTSIYHERRQARRVASTTRRRGKVALRAGRASASIARTAWSSTSGWATATGSSRPACTSSAGQVVRPTKAAAASRRRRTPARVGDAAAPRADALTRRAADARRRRRPAASPAARASISPSGRSTTARSCCT